MRDAVRLLDPERGLERAACFVYVENDENGVPRSVDTSTQAPRSLRPRLKVLAGTVDTREQRATILALHPDCTHCTKPIDGPDAGGVVMTPDGARMAHRHVCFVRAIADHNPHLSLGVAVRHTLEANV